MTLSDPRGGVLTLTDRSYPRRFADAGPNQSVAIKLCGRLYGQVLATPQR